ncbi:DUF192 domain-containing protein [Azospira restricta]|uniref:DUF192 domain-containing protein n=1 Tax=Azospira restricta TaxID=404405 RepID=A0A974SRY7_9RHOO|nr:DUF192 domain-containing protein [Azospira restricta]QRJ65347.1 DUF192 domain-containing protein [Azospira restricta]
MFRVFLIAAALLAGPAAAELPRVALTAGFHRIEAEVAATPDARAQGLMHRRALAPNQGMIFVFPATATHCFWMRNTPLPLSIAFLDESGRIINVDEMAPLTENNHCPQRPARFALEMNAGWFAAKGLTTGAAIGGIDRLPPGR